MHTRCTSPIAFCTQQLSIRGCTVIRISSQLICCHTVYSYCQHVPCFLQAKLLLFTVWLCLKVICHISPDTKFAHWLTCMKSSVGNYKIEHKPVSPEIVWRLVLDGFLSWASPVAERRCIRGSDASDASSMSVSESLKLMSFPRWTRVFFIGFRLQKLTDGNSIAPKTDWNQKFSL